MICGIQDLDIHIINHCDYDSLINLSCTNKHYNKLSNISIVNDMLKRFNYNYIVKKIYNILPGSSCSYCGYGHMVCYHVEFINGYGIVDYFDGCLTYEEECYVSHFDTFEVLNNYIKNIV